MTAATTVAVVIPSYEHARFVGEAVESALSQTRPPDDVVVVDDGSTDGTLDVLRGFGARIRVLENERGGIGSTYNKGVTAVSSDLVAFLESDDALQKTYLEETGDFLEGKREDSTGSPRRASWSTPRGTPPARSRVAVSPAPNSPSKDFSLPSSGPARRPSCVARRSSRWDSMRRTATPPTRTWRCGSR